MKSLYLPYVIPMLTLCGILSSCVPNVTYKGKYGTYTATPSGVLIHPYYAITDDK